MHIILIYDYIVLNNDIKTYYLMFIMESEYPTIDRYLNILKNKLEMAKLFHEFHNGKYEYSKSYLYAFDVDSKSPLLWVEIEDEHLISDIANFINRTMMHYINFNISNEQRIEVIKLSNRLCDSVPCKSILVFLKNEIRDPTFYDTLNRRLPHHLPISNGLVIDLKTGKTRLRNRGDRFTYYSNVSYIDDKTDYFTKFISNIMCDNIEHIEYLQKVLGYCITGDISARVFFIWWGNGANGKSIILNLMKEILDTAYQPVSKEVFIKGNNKCGGCEVLELKDCRLATFSESNAKDCLNEALIKMISGNDSITARGLYKNPVTFTPICKLVLCTNHKPEFNGEDKANTDRVRFIPFNARFIDNPTKPNEYIKVLGMDKIITEKYLDEFFSFCVQGSIKYFSDQKFEPPSGIKECQDDYINERATISNFINDSFVIDKEGLFEKSLIKDLYEGYCKEHDMKIEKISIVHDKLIEIFGKPERQKTKLNRDKTMYKGFKIPEEMVVDCIDDE